MIKIKYKNAGSYCSRREEQMKLKRGKNQLNKKIKKEKMNKHR